MAPPEPIDPATVRCPTCRASQPWSDTCRRCRSDLRLLREMARVYHLDRHQALALLRAGRPRQARDIARRRLALSPDRDARRLLALAALRSGDWPTALAIAREEISG